MVFGFIDNVQYAKGETPASLARLPRDTVGTFNRQAFDDVITGNWQGFDFELYEAVFSQKVNKSTATVFKGVVLSFETERLFPGTLIATRKANKVTSFFRGIFWRRPARAFERRTRAGRGLRLPHRQSGSRDAPGHRPAGAGAAVAVGDVAAGAGAGRTDGPRRVLLLPQSRNLFELPDISVPLDYQAHIAPMISDMGSLLATSRWRSGRRRRRGAVAQLERHNCRDEQERDGVGSDHRDRADRQAVDDPQEHAGCQRRGRAERDVVSATITPDLHDLRQPGDGDDGGDGADEFDGREQVGDFQQGLGCRTSRAGRSLCSAIYQA